MSPWLKEKETEGTAGFRQRLLQTHLKEQVPMWKSYINVSLDKAQLLMRKKSYSSPEGGLKKSKELKPCKFLSKAEKKVRKGNNVTAAESIMFETFFPYTSSSIKDVSLFSKFLESFFTEERGRKKNNKKPQRGSATESHLILFMVMITTNFN